MGKRLTVGLTFVFLAALPHQVLAWNSVGHLAVAKLAYDDLDDGKKAKLFTILKSHPHFTAFLAAGRPPDISEVEWVIMRASIWPDWVRLRENDARGPGVTKHHRGEEHYINIPFINPQDVAAFAGKTLISPDETSILCALKQHCNDLRTKNASAQDKAIAVCWVFHLIGDIHQPMHNVAYFSGNPAFTRGDQGGNKFGVKVNGRAYKLHAYWDELAGEDPSYTDDSPEYQARIFRKALDAAALLRAIQISEVDKAKLVKNTTFESWSQESHEIAKTVAYQKADGTGIIEGVAVQFNQAVPDNAPEVGDKYNQNAKAIANVRMYQAGKRLAERIKSVAFPN